MTIRTNTTTVAFTRPFLLNCAEHTSPAGDYGVVTDEELIEGLSGVCPRNTSALASASAFLTSYSAIRILIFAL
jgi:hypothetical protein